MNDFYTDLAAELHDLADTFAGLAGRGLHAPHDAYVSLLLSVMQSDTPSTIPAVDTIAFALGVAPVLKAMDQHHGEYVAERIGGAVRVKVHCWTGPPADPRDVEIARLRAELDATNSRAATAVPPPTGGSPQVRDQSPDSGPGHSAGEGQGTRPAGAGGKVPAPATVALAAFKDATAAIRAALADKPVTRGHPCIDVPAGVRVLGDPDYGQTKRSS